MHILSEKVLLLLSHVYKVHQIFKNEYRQLRAKLKLVEQVKNGKQSYSIVIFNK